MPAGPGVRGVGGDLDGAAVEARDGFAVLPQHDLVLLVRHLAAAGPLGGPLQHRAVEHRRVEGVPGPQFQPGRRRALAHPPVRGHVALPDPEDGPVGVGDERGAAPGFEGDRTDRDGARPLPDAVHRHIRVVDREVRGPRRRDREVGGQRADARHRDTVQVRHREGLAEAGRAEPPARDRAVETLGRCEVAGHQAHPARRPEDLPRRNLHRSLRP